MALRIGIAPALWIKRYHEIVGRIKPVKEKLLNFIREKYKRVLVMLIFGPILASLLISVAANVFALNDILGEAFIFLCIIYPVEFLIINIAALVLTIMSPDSFLAHSGEARFFGITDLLTVIAGILLSMLYALAIGIDNVEWDAVWDKQLYNSSVHQPIWTGALPTVLTFIIIGVIGYIVLLVRKLHETPPLVTVLCIAAMYIGLSQLILFVIQMFKITPFEGLAYNSYDIPVIVYLPLMELPFCCISMAARLIIRKVYEWNRDEEHEVDKYAGKGIIGFFNEILIDSATWPLAALVAMVPLLGIVLAILSLFGQYPDHVIRAWTETAQWNLSRMKAPPNVQYDEHYLCTVAAGGHEKIVKPIRMGERHGHRIVVNRQLLIANAFEQVLEEKTPGMHRAIRNFYDKHGYPVAKHIKTKAAADIVYFIMKPLEMLFLLVLYLVDAKPENRIAKQYMPDAVMGLAETSI